MDRTSPSSGKVFGAVLLIAGCCIGAGMLGLPVLTALGGFYPAAIFFVLCWLFMTVTGLLLLEVNLHFEKQVSLISMASATLGSFGKNLAWILYLFLFYSLMVAYSSGSGQLLTDVLRQLTPIDAPLWAGSLAFSIGIGGFLYMGMKIVDQINRILMIGLIASYVVLLISGAPHVKGQYLSHVDWNSAYLAIPAMIISFGFHNLVPSLTSYLGRKAKLLKFSIIAGSLIPLFIYLAWQWLILGLVPLEGEGGFREALKQGDMATRALRNATAASWIVDFAESFAFFALVTSFLSVALSFVDFLADGLNIEKTKRGKILLCFLSLAPPFICSIVYPHIFLNALSYAGAFGAVILFGIFPALMVWSGRYRKQWNHMHIIGGGKLLLVCVIAFSCAIVLLELFQQLH